MNSKYSFEKYIYSSRWMSYWYQIMEVLRLNPKNVLEIGVGNNIASTYLKNSGLELKTLDIDEKLNPDVVASVLGMPFRDNCFDVVLCAEVLEHLPFEDFPRALKEIKRVSRKHVVLSLPQWGWTFYLGFKMPLFKKVKIFFKIPWFLRHKFNGEHYWEIGKRGYPWSKIKKSILDSGFQIMKDYITPESPYHHFFILRK